MSLKKSSVVRSPDLPQAMTFAESYADQNERDHQALVESVRKGRVEVYLER